MGPFLRTVVEIMDEHGEKEYTYADDNMGVNECFLEALFHIMPGVVGNNIWKAVHRCPRNPNFAKMQVGKMRELVTRSDEAFIIWTFENFYEGVLEEVESHFADNAGGGSGIATLKAKNRDSPNKGKYAKQGTRKYSGWTPEGKKRWNDLVTDCTMRWNREKPTGIAEEDWSKSVFVKKFEVDWIIRVTGRLLQTREKRVVLARLAIP
jgi:hypothetical protein